MTASLKGKRSRLGVEALEGRTLLASSLVASLSGGILYVEGTAQADYIAVREAGSFSSYLSVDGARIWYNGQYQNSVPSSAVSKVQVVGLGGSDIIDVYLWTGSRISAEVWGGDGNDWIRGGAGNDSLQGNAGNDVIQGGYGNDLLWGQAGYDQLFGQDGNDQLMGGTEDDELIGGAGDDALWGESGSDWLWGESGNDYLDGGTGLDFGWGGAGRDSFAGFRYDVAFSVAGFYSPISHAHASAPGADYLSWQDAYSV